MKLWQKDKASLKEVETFTVGKDREMDLYLAASDVLGSLAHTEMLESVGLLSKDELVQLTATITAVEPMSGLVSLHGPNGEETISVPAGKGIYTISAGERRGDIRYTEADLARPVILTLGD